MVGGVGVEGDGIAGSQVSNSDFVGFQPNKWDKPTKWELTRVIDQLLSGMILRLWITIHRVLFAGIFSMVDV